MLERIGVGSLDDLFASIPEELRLSGPLKLPDGLPEPEAVRLLRRHAEANGANASHAPCFCGAGVYHHFTPSIVPAIMQRSEFLTSYTPYQPERSQGLLQTIYEFQSLVCRLMGLDAANASMYDGATALAEAVVMACSITGRETVLLPDTVHPAFAQVTRTYCQGHGITLETLPAVNGRLNAETVRQALDDSVAAVVLPQPNFFGLLEDVKPVSAAAKEAGAMVIAVVNPIAMALLSPPGEWPADIAVAEGQSLGLPMSYGGPLLGLFACRKEHARQMPGRIVGATVDADGARAYTLTLQTREQHIRREKASSNICSNEALLALGATVYMTLLGRRGLRRVAQLSVERAHALKEAVCAVPGFEAVHDGPFFHEFAVRCPAPVADLNRHLASNGLIGPFDVSRLYPAMENVALFCCTENITPHDIEDLVRSMKAF
jgi:glycine dehydrogenase subunit 1